MQEFVHMHHLSDLPHQVLLEEGDIWPALSRAIEQHEIDLVISGSHGSEGIKNLELGSVAEAVIRHAPCPVMTVGSGVRFDGGATTGVFRQIVYVTDLSQPSEQALHYALLLAEEGQANLTLLHVVEEPPMEAGELRSHRDVIREKQRLQERLLGILPHGAGARCTIEVLIKSGSAAEMILRDAENRPADLIVMGVHGQGAAGAMSCEWWQTLQHVICKAPCPVLTIAGGAEPADWGRRPSPARSV